MDRALAYLGSTRNIVGSVLAIVGLGLTFAGLLGPFWPAVVPAMYLIGVLVVPGRPRISLEDSHTFDAGRIQRALDGTVDLVRGRLPTDVQASVMEIRRRILELLPHAADLPGGAQDLFVLQRTATEYLPTTLRYYLSLPQDYATTRVVQEGKTPLQVLRDQLGIIDGQMTEIAEAVNQRDTDRLLAQGRFLEERFGNPDRELKLPGPRPGGTGGQGRGPA
jgi:hypothetical protein